MAFAPNFDRHLREYLDTHAREYQWKSGWSARDTRWKVDVVGHKKGSDPKRPSVLIEAELKRDDPLGNVVKVWRWAHDTKNKRPILFVHAFSKHYWQKKSEAPKKVRLVSKRLPAQLVDATPA